MMQLIKRYEFDVPIREKQKSEDGLGHKWVTVGSKRMAVDVEIDMSSVASIASVAAHNKSRRSKSGPVIARAREIK